MASIIRWLHLSDFHVGKDNYEQERLFTQLLAEIECWKSDKGFIPDYVFITGDIANKGLKKEYETFRKDFFAPLQNKLDKKTVIVPIPGNHDVERPSPDMLDSEVSLKASSRLFDASKEGKTSRNQITPRFKNYKKMMSANGMSPDWLVSNEGVAVHTREISGVTVGVVGLNTAWLSKDEHDKNKLTPGYRLVEAALTSIGACPIKIVLGHHPPSWWDDSEEGNIRRLFAQHHVLYLHGHKHKSEGRFEEGGVDQFLVLQAGAAFQAREGDRWVNGFSWGELDPIKAEVRISPRCWINGEWPPDMTAITQKRRIAETDWWWFPLPGAQTQAEIEADRISKLTGWVSYDAESLESFAREVFSVDAQRFFDGAEADWALAMSPHFPVRIQAKTLLDSVVNYKGEDRPQIALVRGPTAEGKSMALRQIVAAAVRANADLKVLWHQDETAGINVQDFEKALCGHQRWLLATDHGDMITNELKKLAHNLKRSGRGDIQFVLAAHDTDWKMAKGESVPWYSFARFEEARLSGLPKDDAVSLATAWLHFGASGDSSQSLSPTPESLAEQLIEAAKDNGFDEGALFGALLTLRYGRDLSAHVRVLIQKLDSVHLSFGGTAGEAFRLISAMHAEGLDFLSVEVVQEVLGCDQKDLQREVLRPLMAEAAAGGGAYLRTRHRRIAKATLDICDEDNEDLEGFYLSLAEGAVRLVRNKFGWLDAVWNWEYVLPQHFFTSGRSGLAIRLAEKMLETVPTNSHYAVNLARLKREAGDPAGAIEVLQSATPPKDNRAFWSEWGTICGMVEDYLSNAVLHAYSISDDLNTRPPTVEDAMLALAGLAKAFSELHLKLGHPELHRGRAACAWLGLLISNDDFNSAILKGHQQETTDIGTPFDIADGLVWVCNGFAALSDECLAESVAEKVGSPEQFKFHGLQKQLERSQSPEK